MQICQRRSNCDSKLERFIWLAFHCCYAAAAKSLQWCLTLCDPIDGSPPGSAVPGILQTRALEWVAISFSKAWKWKWSRSVVSNSSRRHGLQPTRLLRLWDSPGKNTGVGCHFLLQCKKVKSESEVSQLCRTLSDPMDCSLPGSSVHGIFQARVLEWGAIAFSGELTLGSIKYWELTQKKPLEYKTRHHPTSSSTLCRTP